MTSPRRAPAHVVPPRAIPGGRIVVEAGDVPFFTDPRPRVSLGSTSVHLSSASSRRIAAVVPIGTDAGRVPVRVNDDDPIGHVDIGKEWATGLHQVDSPVFDREGNLYMTVSGTRGQRVPVSIFRIPPGGAPEPLASGIVNATSLAFDLFGELHVTSRFDGAVYKVKMGGSVEKVASDLGVACGLAFAPDGTMWVGDRSGTLFRVNAAGRAVPFASLPASVAAFHLAIGPNAEVYVSAPTLATRDSVYVVSRRGEVSVFAAGFGRPQGLAVDAEGTLHVADSVVGASGIFRAPRGRARELVVAGDGVIGLAFHPARGAAVATSDAAYVFDRW